MKYDVTLKTLLMGSAPEFLTQLAGTAEARLAPIELPAVVSRTVDLLGGLPDRRLLHAEVQSGNDPAMPCRMLGYYWMLLEQDPKADVVQIVLYIGEAPLRMTGGLTRTGLSLTYRMIDIRTLDPAPLLASEAVGDIIASLLCCADDIPARVHDIVQRLLSVRRRDPEAVRDGLARLVLLGDLRSAGEAIEREIRDMPIEIDVDRNPILHRIANKGRAEGKAETLLRQLERRFGAVPAARREQVAGADLPALDHWLDRILDAPTVDAVFAEPMPN